MTMALLRQFLYSSDWYFTIFAVKIAKLLANQVFEQNVIAAHYKIAGMRANNVAFLQSHQVVNPGMRSADKMRKKFRLLAYKDGAGLLSEGKKLYSSFKRG
jgi:hypothetical protein